MIKRFNSILLVCLFSLLFILTSCNTSFKKDDETNDFDYFVKKIKKKNYNEAFFLDNRKSLNIENNIREKYRNLLKYLNINLC